MRHVIIRLILAAPLLAILLVPSPRQSIASEAYPAVASLGAAGMSVASAIAKGNPKLESALDQLVAAYRNGGLGSAKKFVGDHGIPMSSETVLVIAQALPSRQDELVAGVLALGAVVEKTYDHLVQIRSLLPLLEPIASLPSVGFVRLPEVFQAQGGLVETEGALTIGAKKWHEAGVKGRGVKVAVLDGGFQGYQQLLNSDLPALANVKVRSFRSDENIEAETDHGTAIAEIIYDLAPDAELYLVNYSTELEFAQAVDWLVSEGVRVVSHSVGKFADPLNGSGDEDRKVDDAVSRGVIWVNAAGNHANQHYSNVFTDKDGDGWNEWRFGSKLFPITVRPAPQGVLNVNILVTWDDWPASDIDYDLYLLDSSGQNALSYSITPQDGSQPPVENIKGRLSCGSDPQSDGSCTVYAAVRKYSKDRDARLTLWNLAYPYSENFPYYNNTEGSTLSPATARGAWAVGAIRSTLFSDKLEPYSSQGPTADGRVKPDFAAPAAVSTRAYGPGGFAGTSAATPHVAGAAALVLSFNPALTVDEVRVFLEKRARPLGTPGKNNQYGVGGVDLGLLPQLEAGVGGDGAIGLAEGNASFAFGVGRDETYRSQGWLTYAGPGLGSFQSASVGVLMMSGGHASFWGFGRFTGDGRLYSFNVNVRGKSGAEDRFGISVWNAATGELAHQAEGQLVGGAIKTSGESSRPSTPPVAPTG